MPPDNHSSTFGPYQLLHQLGAGGMGQVFLATQAGEHSIRRLVAVKRILSHLTSSPKLVQLFLDEVRIASQINHGNIVQVLDHGSIDGRYFMAMEYVHGENLAAIYERLHPAEKRFATDLLLQAISEVCQGLDHAHGKLGMDGRPLGIIHRDISPHNIMLSLQGEVKIADFGVARAAEQTHQTLGGELRGKVGYMSPEQAYGKPLDTRSDLFSLGVVLYEGLTGENPLARATMLATLEAARAAQIPPIREKRPDLPLELTELLDSTLTADPAQRPDSARAMHEGLQRIMRVNNMATTTFDLADYMKALFPTGESPSTGTSEATAPGRRADEQEQKTSPTPPLERQIQHTLFYLRQRHPEGDLTLPPLPEEGEARAATANRSLSSTALTRGHPWLIVAALLLLAGGLGMALLFSPQADLLPAPAVDATPRVKTPPPDATPQARAPRRDTAPNRVSDGGVAAALAQLRVESTPSRAKVLLDGRSLGLTPLRRKLPAGRRRLTLRSAHHEIHSETITLHHGKTSVFKRRLTPMPAELSVHSRPRCQLTLDGKSAGHTPLRRKLSPGRISLRCRYGKAVARHTERLRPGQSHEVHFGFGTLAINVQPWARVIIDGKARGETPLSVVLSAGSHKLQLENAQAKRRREKTVQVRAALTTRISSW